MGPGTARFINDAAVYISGSAGSLVDPVNAKYYQLFIIEGLGAVAFLDGVWLAFLALAGKTQWVVELPGCEARSSRAPLADW